MVYPPYHVKSTVYTTPAYSKLAAGAFTSWCSVVPGLECRLGVPVHCLQSNGVIIHNYYDVTHVHIMQLLQGC